MGSKVVDVMSSKNFKLRNRFENWRGNQVQYGDYEKVSDNKDGLVLVTSEIVKRSNHLRSKVRPPATLKVCS